MNGVQGPDKPHGWQQPFSELQISCPIQFCPNGPHSKKRPSPMLVPGRFSLLHTQTNTRVSTQRAKESGHGASTKDHRRQVVRCTRTDYLSVRDDVALYLPFIMLYRNVINDKQQICRVFQEIVAKENQCHLNFYKLK